MLVQDLMEHPRGVDRMELERGQHRGLTAPDVVETHAWRNPCVGCRGFSIPQ